jgi:hypothetical protein
MPVPTWKPTNILVSPYSKNADDDILYTLVVQHFNQSFPNHPERLAAILANMWRNYNETFRDLLITWLNIYSEIQKP